MKKYNVFKILAISILATIVLSFLIPQTTFDSYGNLSVESINPVSIIDTFANSYTSLGVFLNVFVYILCIGVFYTVLKKSNKYDEIINNIAYLFRNVKFIFPVISILLFVILTAIIGDMIPMLVFVPIFIDISRKIGYDKNSSIFMTLGSIILGSVGSLYTNYTNQILGSVVTDNILIKIFILFIMIASSIVFVLVFSKKPEDTKLEKVKSSKGIIIPILFYIILLFIFIGMTPWNGYFGFDWFSKIHESITEFKIFNVPLFYSIIGASVNALGSWTIFDLSVLLLIFSLVSSIIFRLKFDELFEALAKGIKNSLSYALIIVFANIILVNVYNSGFFYTIINTIGKMNDKLFAGTLISALSSFVYPDYMYASQFTLSTVAAVITDQEFYVVLALIFQVIYSLFLLIMPTSILVLIGLQYTRVSFKEWIKYIFKYVMVVFALVFAVLFVSSIKFIGVPSIIALILLSIISLALIVINILSMISKNENSNNKVSIENKTEEISENKVVKEEKKVEKKETAKKSQTKSKTKKNSNKKSKK